MYYVANLSKNMKLYVLCNLLSLRIGLIFSLKLNFKIEFWA